MTASTHLTALSTARILGSLTITASPDVQTVPFSALTPSTLNPRKAFNHEELVELARNIYERTTFDAQGNVTASGILQNLLARPNGAGAELAAGERRYRAVELLVGGLKIEVRQGTDANGLPVMGEDFIHVPASYPLPVLVQDMTDAQLIEAATVENIMRASMTPMEEADAFLSLIGTGKDEDYIALKYGMHPNTVRSRLQLAAGLGQEGRKMLDEGMISLDTAKLIASTSGELKKTLLERAKYRDNHEQLKYLVKNVGFLVEHAIFDVEASGLHIDLGLLGDLPAKFSNPRAAFDAQVAALEAVKQEQIATGKWTDVILVPVNDHHAQLPYNEWENRWSVPKEMQSNILAITYSLNNGKVQTHEGVARKADVQAFQKTQRAEGKRVSGPTPKSEQTGAGVREAAHLIGHKTRTQALDAYHAANPKATLALACLTLMQRESHSGTALMGLKVDGRKEAPMTPETAALAGLIAARFPLFTTDPDTGLLKVPRAEISGFTWEHASDALNAPDVTEADLTLIFAYFTHRQVGEWQHSANRPGRALNSYAERVGAAAEVQKRFTLTPEFLNAYTTADLTLMIATMPAELRPAPKNGGSKKDLVGLVMERAAALKAAGWLPEIVAFQD